MALFLPPIDPTTLEHGSEADLARAMLLNLRDAFIVIHSLPWVSPARHDVDAPSREGEADFVVLHRSYGVLILEAKGGEIILQNRVWQRRTPDGLVDIKDPVRQARRSIHALRERVKVVCGRDIAERTRFSAAVAFPHCLYKDVPPADLPRQAILDLDDLGAIEPAILRAFRGGGGERTDLSGEELDAVRRALAPEFRLYEPLHVSVDAAVDKLARLTRQQLLVLKGCATNERAIIEGVAGSGKTLLAMQRAKSFTLQHHAVLFTCYNIELAKWLRDELAADLVENGGGLTVRLFHGFAADLCKRAAVDFPVPPQDTSEWWDRIAPDLMVQAVEELSPERAMFDAIVVDEAQDFSPGWWDALAYLTNLDDQAPIWAFLDKAQSLHRESCDLPIKGAFRFTLDINCRNTCRIVASANSATHNEEEPFEFAPLGRPPRVIIAASPSQVSGLFQQEVRALLSDHRLAPRQIALIGPAAYPRSALASCPAIDGVPLIASAADWREGRGILCTTARSFKGLEADVVILYDVSGLGFLLTVSDLYVAMTRARSHLFIIARDRSCKTILDRALAAALAVGSEE